MPGVVSVWPELLWQPEKSIPKTAAVQGTRALNRVGLNGIVVSSSLRVETRVHPITPRCTLAFLRSKHAVLLSMIDGSTRVDETRGFNPVYY